MRRLALLCLPFLLAGCGATPKPQVASENAVISGFYAATTAGATVTHDYSVGDDPSANPDIANLDNHGVGFEGLVGWQFEGGALAAELTYVDLGNLKADGPAFGGFTDELKAHGFGVSAVGTYPPASPLAGQARVGAFRWTQSIDYHDASEDYVADESGVGASAGVGLRYRIPSVPQLGVTAGWTRYFKVGDPDKSGHQYDRDFIGGGVSWSFGSGNATQ